VPALAFSARSSGTWPDWVRWSWSPEAVEMWERMAAISAEIVEVILTEGFPKDADVVSVNMPSGADLDTPRRVTRLATTRYGPLFASKGEALLAHAFDGVIHVEGDPSGTDVGEADAGYVTVTPIRLASSGSIEDALKQALERGGTPGNGAVV